MTNFQVQTKFSANGNIDAEKGIIRGVSLITEGSVDGHRCYADSQTLTSVLAACKRLKKLKTKCNHGPDVGAIVGSITNFRIEGNQVKGDLTLLKNSPSRDFVLELAKELSDQFGLSIAFEPDFEKKDGKDWVRCKTIYSADIVDAPAANKDGLFDSSPMLTNTATSIPTGVKPKTRTLSIVCPNCEKHLETFSKLAVLHSAAADKLDAYINSLEVAQRDNISSQNNEAEFERRLEVQRLELEAQFDKKASIAACRMLASTGVKLSRIPDADTAMTSGGDILDRMNAIQDPTQRGLFYQANKDAVNTAFQKRSAKKTQLENLR